MCRFFTWFNNIKIRYKSKRFIVSFIFTLGFIFFPKDVFAQQLPTGITFYDENYNVLDKCTNCTELYNIVDGYFEPYYNVYRVRFTYEDIGLYKNLQYNFNSKFLLNYCLGHPIAYIGLCFGSNGCLDMSGYTFKVIDKIYDSPTPAAEAFTYQFTHDWTQPVNTDEFFIEVYFDRPMDMFLGASLESVLTATGDSSSDIIANVGQNIIDNQNKNQQQTNEKLDKIDESINNDDTSSAEEKANGFFDNFKLEDNGGISSVVTMPLRIIEGLVSGSSSCQNLSFSVFDKDVYFPSGCILWGSAPDSIVVIYQTLICGLFGYILLIRLFKDIESLKNPNDSGVSTLDL